MRKSIIVAAAQNGIIGKDGQLPWKLPADMKRFQELTMRHALIMGRKTYESLPKKLRPLPGRETVMLTSSAASDGKVLVASSLAQALDKAEAAEHTIRRSDDDGYLDPEIFICGGAAVYKEALPLCDRVILTVIEQDYEGDVSFPYPELLLHPSTQQEFVECAGAHWERTSSRAGTTPGEGEPAHRFEIWQRLR